MGTKYSRGLGLLLTALVAVPGVAFARDAQAVSPGKRAVIALDGLFPSRPLTVTLSPRGVPGASRTVRGTFSSDARGRATVRFAWPRTYAVCPAPGACRTRPFRAGMLVRVVALQDWDGALRVVSVPARVAGS